MSVSIMMLPTKCTRSTGMPSARRCGCASRLGVSSRSEQRSVRTRFTSSGMRQSPLRRPASRCARRTPSSSRSFTVTSAAASVEFTSPGTRTQSGRASSSTGSKRSMMRAVCAAWLPPPTPRKWSGARIPRSSKNDCDMLAS
jgi:hypothetical protein